MNIKYRYPGLFKPEALRPDNIDHLSTAMVPQHSKLLELGCATGFMSRYFLKQKNCQVTGVDLSQTAIKKAKAYCQTIIQGNLDKASTWQKIKLNKPFDVVFASAIIEHLKDENLFLNRIREVLKPQGILIITIPNAAHWRQRLNLFLGHWQYQDYGLLDRTHLRFFTYYSFLDLVKKHQFAVLDIKIDPAGGIKFLNFLAKHFPNFYAHQIVYKLQKL